MMLSTALKYFECHYADVIMLNVIMLSVIILNVIMLSVIIFNVIMLSVIMLNVVAPSKGLPMNSKVISCKTFWG